MKTLKTKFNHYTKETVIILSMLMIISMTLTFSSLPSAAAQDTSDLLQYTYENFDGGAEYHRFATGPGPNTPNILFREHIQGLGSMMIATHGYIMAKRGSTVMALDPFDAHVVWETATGGGGQLIMLDENHLMTGDGAGYAICLNPANGDVIWEDKPVRVGATASVCSVYSPEEKMYYSLSTALSWSVYETDIQPIHIVAYDFSDINNPTIAWTHPVEMLAVDSSLWYGGGNVYASENAGFISAYDARTGELQWRTPCTGTRGFAGSYYNGKVLHGGQDNSFYCLDAETGVIEWVFDPQTFWGFWSAGSAAAYGNVYELNTDGGLYCINVETGGLVWKYQGPGHFYPGFPIVADGKVYAATGTGNTRNQDTGEFQKDEVACLDAYTGKVIWTLPISINIHDGPIVAYGNLYFRAAKGIPGVVYSVSQNELWCISDLNNNWSNFRKDPAQTAESAGPTNLALKWKFQTCGQVVSSPTIVDNIVYAGSQDKNIYALNADTGEMIWNFQVGFPVRSSMAVAAGMVFTGADDGWIYALDALTGQEYWRTFAGGITYFGHGMDVLQLRSSPIYMDGRVYVGSLDKHFYCLNSLTGTPIWSFDAQGEVTSTAAVIAGDGIYFSASTQPISEAATGRFIAGNSNFTLYKLDFSGNKIWELGIPRTSLTLSNQIHYDMPMSPTVVDGRIFMHDDVSNILCINATTSEMIYTIPLTAGGTGREYLHSSSILYANGRIYSPDYFQLSAFNATNGEKLWSQWLGREVLCSPSYAYGKVYCGNEEGTFRVMDEVTGKTLSFYHPGTNIWSSPALYDGRLYWGAGDFYIYCFEEADLGLTSYYGEQGTGTWTTSSATTSTASDDTPVAAPSPVIADNLADDIPNKITAVEPEGAVESAAVLTVDLYAVTTIAVAVIAVASVVIYTRKRK